MPRSKNTKSLALIRAEIRSLNEELETALSNQARLIGDMAIEAGLSDVPLADLKSAFKELANRFRSQGNQQTVAD